MGDGPGALLAMFAAAFGAATILPFQSEIVFAAIQIAGEVPLWWLIAVASIGNTLGSCVNYALGAGLERFRHRRWFPLTEAQLDRSQAWFRRWGVWSLLLSWAPFGDGLTVVAGVMRTPFAVFLALVAVAKTGRYLALALLTASVSGG
ncbi:DedA family protein [Rhodobacteraceae bacterium CCMM004]|nr:DedA family protein [Rhodobacteraceae bacterium CCMM004]